MSLYGFLIGIALVIGISYFSKNNTIIPKSQETKFSLLLIVFSILGARVYHVLGNLDYYSQYPLQVLNIRGGGLGIYGAIIFGLVFIYLYCFHHKYQFLKVLNQLVTIIPLCQAVGRWGNYVNTEGFGIPTYIDVGQYVPLYYRPVIFQQYSFFHPAWLYESILDLVLFVILFTRKDKSQNFPIYLVGYGLIRFFMEFLRWDTWAFNGLKIAQIISLLLVVTGIMLRKSSSK